MNPIPDAPILESNDAHVWMLRAEISSDQFAEFRNLLSKDENARADRFIFEPDRLRFIASHGWLRSLPVDQRIHGFFRLWSVKEAILKADGKGMSIPLSDVDTSSVLARTSFNVTLPDGGRLLSFWVGELHAAEGYTATLAVEGDAPGVRIMEFDAPAD